MAERVPPPSRSDVMRYRYHHGTNLGSVFVLERWLTPSMFPKGAPGDSELAAVEAWVRLEGIQKTREIFEKHWRTYVSDTDLDWLKHVAKCTTVRLPIGYFALGPQYCARTPFSKVSEVYQQAWAAVLALAQRCQDRGIGVLVDFHALPGGANTGIHSGTDSGKAEFWTSPACRDLATRCLCFIAKSVKTVENVVGIQVVNEAEYHAPGMYQWYDAVLAELSAIDVDMPMYFSDGWDLKQAVTWSQHKNAIKSTHVNPVVIDTHCYWCFSDSDKQKTPQQIIGETSSTLSALDGKDGNVIDHGVAQVVVGEHSCVLDEQTWKKSAPHSRSQLVDDFGKAQCKRFQQRAGGSFFWTFRMDWMNGGEWGFRQMTESQAIVPPRALTLSPDEIRRHVHVGKSQLASRKRDAVTAHNSYWDSTYPGRYEHERFEQGFSVGYNDAMVFFELRASQGLDGADQIGMLDLWCLKRLRDGAPGLSGGGFGWEFEHGMREGVRGFYECVGL